MPAYALAVLLAITAASGLGCGPKQGPGTVSASGPGGTDSQDADAEDEADGAGARLDAGASDAMMPLPWANGGCPSAFLRASRVISTVIFVIDGSSSMNTCFRPDTPDADTFGSCSSRWEAMRSALVEDGEIISTFDGVLSFGLVLYSTPPFDDLGQAERKCPDLRTVWPALDNGQLIESEIPGSSLGGSTPTGHALRYAIDVMHRPRAPDEPTVGPTYLVLATDGAPNGCPDTLSTNPQLEVLNAVTDGAGKGITTFVLSLADESDTGHLERVAEAGGSEEPFRPGDEEELIAVMETIVGRTLSCKVALDGYVQEEHACDGHVTLGGNPLDCNDPDGWRLDEANILELQGAACEEFKTNLGAELSAEFDCSIQRPD